MLQFSSFKFLTVSKGRRFSLQNDKVLDSLQGTC